MAPLRPPEHVLETRSRQELERLLPTDWVVREVTPDYGIDREVEIFEGGVSTGLTFKVQLKASQETAASGPSRRVKADTLRYWKSLDVPVLIAYFAADSGRMYGRWAHTVGREPGFNRDAKTTTVRFTEDERLLAETARERLGLDVAMVRDLRAQRLPRPLPVRLVVDDGTVRGLTSAQVTVRLRQAIRDRGLDRDVSLLRPGDDGAAVEVSLSAGAEAVLRAALPADLATMRAVLPAGIYGPGDVKGLLADDILVAVAFVVERTGATATAARLLDVSAPQSFLTSLPDVALAVSATLAEEGQARAALRLAVRQWASDEPHRRDVGDLYYRALLHQVRALRPDDLGELIDAMRRRADAERSSPAPHRAGQAYYNLAQALNAIGRTPQAVNAMNAALEHDPGYGQRSYFFRERGGMHWDICRFADAAEDYRRALALGGDVGELVPLLADTLLYAGQYTEAAKVLEQWTPTGHHLDGLALLVRTAVTELRSVTGLDSQEREAASMAEVDAAAEDEARLLSLLTRTDALDPRIWLRLVRDGEQLPRLVLVALMALNSANAWAVATVAAMDPLAPADPALVAALIEAGERLSDSPFAEAVDAVLEGFENDPDAGTIRDAIYLSLSGLDEARPATTVRLVFD